MERKAYPSDVSDEEWALVAPCLALMKEDALQREYPLREVFNGLHWIVRTGAPWQLMPHDLPPWDIIYLQSRRWMKAGVFESLVYDLRAVLRIADGRKESPTAAILIAKLCNRHLKAANVQATTGPSVEKAIRSTWQSIRSGTCSPYL